MSKRIRTARKVWPCWYRCGKTIQPGQQYLETTDFPSNYLGYAITVGHPLRFQTCKPCADLRGYWPDEATTRAVAP